MLKFLDVNFVTDDLVDSVVAHIITLVFSFWLIMLFKIALLVML